MKIKENKKAPLFKLFGTRNTRFDLKKIKSKLVVYFILQMTHQDALLKPRIFQDFIKNLKK